MTVFLHFLIGFFIGYGGMSFVQDNVCFVLGSA
jgi:hypothetical protein